jgi:hypothetical protein
MYQIDFKVLFLFYKENMHTDENNHK